MPARELRRASRSARERVERLLADEPHAGGGRRATRDADVDRDGLPRVALAGMDPKPGLASMKGDRALSLDRRAGDHAGGRVDATWHVDAHHTLACRVHGLYRIRHLAVRHAREARSEQSVNEPLGALQGGVRPGLAESQRRRARQALQVGACVRRELVGRGGANDRHLPRGLTQKPSDHQAIAAVVALAAHHRQRAVWHEPLDGLRDAFAGTLHQVERGDASLLDRPAVHRPHPRRGCAADLR